MAVRHEVLDGAADAAVVVAEDGVATGAADRAVHVDDRGVAGLEDGIRGCALVGGDDDDAVDPAAHQGLDDGALAGRGPLGGGGDELVLPDARLALDGRTHLRVEGVGEVLDDEGDGERPALAHEAGAVVTTEAEPLDDGADPLGRVGTHAGLVVDHARDGLDGDVGLGGDVGHGRAGGCPVVRQRCHARSLTSADGRDGNVRDPGAGPKPKFCPIRCPDRTRSFRAVDALCPVREVSQGRSAARGRWCRLTSARLKTSGSTTSTEEPMSKRTGIHRGVIALAVLATATVGRDRRSRPGGCPRRHCRGAAVGTRRRLPVRVTSRRSFETGQPQPELSTVEVGARRPATAERLRHRERGREPARLGRRASPRARRTRPARSPRTSPTPTRDSKWLAFASTGWVRYQLGTPATAVKLLADLGQRLARARPQGLHPPGLERRHDVDRPRPPDRHRLLGPLRDAHLQRHDTGRRTRTTGSNVTAATPARIVQLADWDISDGRTPGRPATPMEPSSAPARSAASTSSRSPASPACKALRYSGGHTGRRPLATRRNRLFDVDIPVGPKTRLSLQDLPRHDHRATCSTRPPTPPSTCTSPTAPTCPTSVAGRPARRRR